MLKPAGIVQQAIDLGALPTDTPVGDLDAVDAALGQLARSATDGQPRALEVMAQTGTQLARAAQTLVNLLDTDILVLGGPTGTKLGEDVGAIGAAALALDRTFSPRTSAFVLS